MVEEWDEEEEVSNLLHVETPSASRLPSCIRLRAFTDCVTTRADCSHGTQNCLHKRRRFDETCDRNVSPFRRPLPRVRCAPIDISARRYETFVWLEAPREAAEISARFALDRRLGAAPSLAATHRALSQWRASHSAEAIADAAEDIALRAPSIRTVCRLVSAFMEDPRRAARVALSMAPLATDGALPAAVWASLCDALDRTARAEVDVDAAFLDLFAVVLSRAVASGGPRTGAVVGYGQALLRSARPMPRAAQLVRDTLLAPRAPLGTGEDGDETDGADRTRLAAFVSDLLRVLSKDGFGAETCLPRGERRALCGALLQYANRHQLRLAPSGLDAFLSFCDTAGDYYAVCVGFLAMCALSTPSLVAFGRVVEVLGVAELSKAVDALLGGAALGLLEYAMLRHGRGMFAEGTDSEELAVHVCTCLAQLCARDGNAVRWVSIFFAIIDAESAAGAHAFICAMRRFSWKTGGTRNAPSTPLDALQVAALESCRVEALQYALFPVQLDASCQEKSLWSGLWRASGAREYVSLESALATLFSSPAVYGTVMDVSAVCALAVCEPLATAFAKMMGGYASKTGAVCIVPFDVCAADALYLEGRQLLASWLSQFEWMVELPLSLTAQLVIPAGDDTKGEEERIDTSLSVCVQLFHAVRRGGHNKVAFVTADAKDADTAKAEEVRPVITLAELKARLGID